MSIFTDSLNKETAIWFDYFAKGFRGLMPYDKDIFLKKFLEEQEEARKIAMLEEVAQEKIELNEMNTTDFIKAMQDEVENLAQENTQTNNQKNTNDNTITNTNATTNDKAQSIQNINSNHAQESNQQTQATMSQDEAKAIIEKHQQNIAKAFDKTTEHNLAQPTISYEDFKDNVLYPQQKEFIKNHREELLQAQVLSIVDIGGEKVDVFDNTIITPEEKIKQMYENYLHSPNQSQWNADFDIEEIKQKRTQDNDFLDTFRQEAQSCITPQDIQAKSLADVKKNLNPDTYFADMTDWFRQKQVQNANMPMSKEIFKQEFFEYCKNGMSENEMKILLILDNKNPSKLTKEHKEMIKEGLKLCTTNNKLFDKGLHTAIEASLVDREVKLTNNKVLDFAQTLEKMADSKNPIDRKFLEGGAAKNIIDKIKDKEKTPNLRKEMAEKMDNALDKALQAHSKKITIEQKEKLEAKGQVFDNAQNQTQDSMQKTTQVDSQTNTQQTQQGQQPQKAGGDTLDAQSNNNATAPKSQQGQSNATTQTNTQPTQTQSQTPPKVSPKRSRGR